MDIAYIEMRLSGGASNADAAASLGGAMSTTTAVRGESLSGTVPGVTFLDGAGNPASAGTVTYTHNGGTGRTLQWTPNGGTIGAAVVVDASARYKIESADTAKFITISVTAGSLPSADNTYNVTPSALANKVFDDISKDESLAGDVEYRCLYLINTGASSATSIKLWVSDPAGADSLMLGLDPAGAGGTATTIANEGTAPTGVTFATKDSVSNALSIGTLTAGQAFPFWIKRTVPAATLTSTSADTCTFGIAAAA